MTSATQGASRDDNETTTSTAALVCPVCQRPFHPVRRQLYCCPACRKTAFRRRHTTATIPTFPAASPRRTVTLYQCPSCEQRQVGQQRCPDCNTFGQALGMAGTCPHCDGLIAAADLDSNP